ncbi:MAG: DUF5677 domain-containing protein [Lautropia sp.]
MEAQARAVLRQGLEALFALGAIERDPSTYDRLVEAHQHERMRTVKHAKAWAPQSVQNVFATYAQPGENGEREPRSLSTASLAEAADMMGDCRSLYSILSWSVHPTAHDLDRHLVSDNKGDLTELQMSPVIEQRVSWEAACAIQIRSLQIIGRLFRKMERLRTDRLAAKLAELVAQAC